MLVDRRQQVGGVGVRVEDGHAQQGRGAGLPSDLPPRSMTHTIGSLTASDDLTLFTRRWTPDRGPRAVVVLVHGVHEHSGRYAGRRERADAPRLRGPRARPAGARAVARPARPRRGVRRVRRRPEHLPGPGPRPGRRGAGVPDGPLDGRARGGLDRRPPRDRRAWPASSCRRRRWRSTGRRSSWRRWRPFVARWLPNVPVTRLDLSQAVARPDGRARLPRGPADDQAGRPRPAGVRGRPGHRRRPRPARGVRRAALPVPRRRRRDHDPAGTRWLAEHAASDDVTLKLWPGLYHETLNEPERDRVIGALGDWLVAHLPRLGDATGAGRA